MLINGNGMNEICKIIANGNTERDSGNLIIKRIHPSVESFYRLMYPNKVGTYYREANCKS